MTLPALRPDPARSVVGLISALAGRAAPAVDHYPPVAEIEALRPRQRPVVLLVVDGLGDRWLASQRDSFALRHRKTSLTTVFPTTTAAAVSALALGVAPNRHGVPAWFTYLPELGCVALPLPFMPRGSRESFTARGVEASAIVGAAPLLPRLGRPAAVVQPHYIAESTYSRALFGDTSRYPHRSLDHLFGQIEAALEVGPNPLIWAYWTELDATAHRHGIGSEQARSHFAAIDQALASFCERMAGRDLLVIVTADHGMVDLVAGGEIWLEDHPALKEMLALPLCGEPRAPFCHLREGCGAAFDSYMAEVLPQVAVYESRALLEAGLFGAGPSMAGFARRIGDRVLLPPPGQVMRDQLLQEQRAALVGYHGGLSADELEVPLILIEP